MFNSRFRAATRGVAGMICLLVVTAAFTPAARAAEDAAADGTAPSAADAAAGAATGTDPLQTVVVTARRLNEARAGIETQTGASTYTIDSDGHRRDARAATTCS